jgi:hypothetical protein
VNGIRPTLKRRSGRERAARPDIFVKGVVGMTEAGRRTGVFDSNDVELKEGDVVRFQEGTYHLIFWDEGKQAFMARMINQMDNESRALFLQVAGPNALDPIPVEELSSLWGGSSSFVIDDDSEPPSPKIIG